MAALDADYRGSSIQMMPVSGNNPDLVVLTVTDRQMRIGRPWLPAPPPLPVSVHLVETAPAWGRPVNFAGVPGPRLAVTAVAGPQLSVATFYDTAFTADLEGQRNMSVRQYVVRYSTVNYPLDIFGDDDRQSVALVNRDAWDGANRTDVTAVTGGLPLGVYYVTAWALGIEGISEPSRARLEIV